MSDYEPKRHSSQSICRTEGTLPYIASLTFGDLGPLLVEGVVELVVLALQRVDLLVELGLDLGRLELQLLERLQSTLHGCGQ